jgi:hypothetical protein
MPAGFVAPARPLLTTTARPGMNGPRDQIRWLSADRPQRLGPSHPLVVIRNRLHRHLSERERQLLSFVLTWLSIFNLEVLSRHLKNGFASSGVP